MLFVLYLRTVLEPSLLKLWKSLFAHFVNLIKNIVMLADEVADMFGPLLISSHSVHRKEVSHRFYVIQLSHAREKLGN